MSTPATSNPARARFEAYLHRRKPAWGAPALSLDPRDAACAGPRYADPVVQARWEFWQDAQPGPLNLASARAYLAKLCARAVFNAERAAILRGAQHLMRCIRNDNPEYF
jgi:hypothetical protein